MGITAAQLTANVSVTGVDQATNQLKGFGSSIGGIAIATAGAAIGIGAASVKMAGDFQSGMTSLVTGAGESQKNIKLVSDGILSMATQTGTSTKQLTDGMYMIESAGFHGATGLQVLQAAAEGAKVGNADLQTVASAVTTVLHDYANSGITATQATNALISTVASGKTHMQDLSASLSTVLPLASSLHISFQDVAGALATMTNAGVPAQQASQNLAFAIRSLSNESGPGTKALQSIGLSADQLHNVLTTQGLPAALQLIEDHIGQKWPLSSAEGQKALKDIMGGAAGLNVALDIGGSHMKEYTGDISSIASTLKSGSKDVQGWANVQADFNFKLDQAKEVVETLGIKLGTALLPIVGKVLDAFSTFAPKIMDALSKIDFSGIQKTLTPIGATISSIFSKIDWSGIANNIKSVGQSFINLSPGVQLFQALSQHAQELGKWFNTSVVPALKQAEPGFRNLYTAVQGLLPVFVQISTVVRDVFQKAFAALLPVFQAAVPVIIQLAGIIANLLGSAIKFLAPYVVQATTAIMQFAGAIIDRVSPIVIQFFNNLKVFLSWVQQNWGPIWGVLGPILQGVWNIIVGIVKIAWSLVSGIILVGLDLISGNWSSAWNDMKNMLSGIWGGIQSIIKGEINIMIGVLNLGIEALSSFIDSVEHALNSAASAVGLGNPIPITSIPLIPTYAEGTENHPGGAALVGEKGPEIALLPKGTAVIPADKTKELLSYAGGTKDWLSSLTDWITGGVSEIVKNLLSGIHLPSLLGNSINFAEGITNEITKWVTQWVQKTLLPKIPGQSGGSAGPGQAVNIPGSLLDWINAAIQLTGVSANWANDLGIIAMHESGGNPNAINNWDINAQEGHPSQGIMQTIPSTFAANMVSGHGNILNPIDNIAAAINYIKARYGSVFNVPGIVSMSHGGAYQGYANGTDFAEGGLSWVGEKGKELMYVPRGAQITPNNQLKQQLQPIIQVHPAPIYLDGRILANNQLPYLVDAIRYNVGSHGI